MQLHRHSEAVAYLHQRGVRSPELIEHMRIGYAPGGCLRAWLTQLGYSLQCLGQAGLVTAAGYDTYAHRIVFPLEENLYGRSLSAAAPPHRFLPGAKGGLVRVGAGPAISGSDSRRGPVRLRRVVAGRISQRHLLVGQPISMRASFGNSVDGPRTVYLAFDNDSERQRPAGGAIACVPAHRARRKRAHRSAA